MAEEPLIRHRYTVLEIERMRKALYEVMFPLVWTSVIGGQAHGGRDGTGGRPGEEEEKIERQLRTYLLAGIRPEELEQLAEQRITESHQQLETMMQESRHD